MNLQVLSELLEVDLKRTKVSKKHDEIISELSKKLQRIANKLKQMPKDQLKPRYENEVRDLIQLYVEDAYFLGQEYADTMRGRKPVTVNDVYAILSLTSDISQHFWGALLRTEIKEFSLDFLGVIISRMVSDAITKSINQGTLSFPLPDFQEPTQTTKQILVTFTTRRDERVCPICEDLDGNEYELDDLNKPVIPDDTHPRCRCRYVIDNGV